MENIQRNMERKIKMTSLPNHIRRKEEWNVLFLSDYGRTFIIKKLKLLLLFFLFFFIISIISSFFFFFLYKDRVEKFEKLNTNMLAMQKKLDKLNKEKEILLTASVIKKSVAEYGAVLKNPVDINNNLSEETKEPAPAAKKEIIDVEQFNIIHDKDLGELNISFNVRKMLDDTEMPTLAGYVFVIIQGYNSNAEKFKVVPTVSLLNGFPDKFFKGKPFVIKKFKKMDFKAAGIKEEDNMFKNALVLIYDRNGDIIFQKDFEILL